MDVSLIVATVDRVDATRRLLDSLSRQRFCGSFEVIVVDQNPDDRLVELVATYGRQFPIRHVRQQRRLLSRARNAGLEWAGGDLIGFPDDDCVYEPTTLHAVTAFFRDHPDQSGVIGNVLGLGGDDPVMLIGAPPGPGPVDQALAWEVGMTAAFFIRATAARPLRFDERIGPGTWWGCGEDVDFMLRGMDLGARVYYEPGIVVRHPRPNDTYTTMELVRRYSSYARGTGYLMGKRRFPLKSVVGCVLEPIVKLGWFMRQRRWKDLPSLPVTSVGRIIGYLGYWTSALARTRDDAHRSPHRAPGDSR